MPTKDALSALLGSVLMAGFLCGCQATPPASPQPAGPVKPTPSSQPNTSGENEVNLAGVDFKNLSTEDLAKVLQEMSADDYPTRQNAVITLKRQLVKQARQNVALQTIMLRIQQNLAEQLHQMTLTNDPEAQGRVAGLMEFNLALTRWTIETFNLPPQKRDVLLKWGLSNQGYELVAKAYSRRTDNRLAAIKELGGIKNEASDYLLGMLVQDSSREVSLTAMDAIWDRPLSEEVIMLLWNRAVGNQLQQNRVRYNVNRVITVHGRVINYYDQENNYNINSQECEVAADLLVDAKVSKVSDLLNSAFKEMAESARDPNDSRWRMLSPNYGSLGQSLNKLVDAYQPSGAVNCLAKILIANQNSNRQEGYVIQMNNVNYYQSPTVDVVAMLVQLTKQDLGTYKLQRVPNYGNRVMLSTDAKQNDQIAGMKDEAKLVRKTLLWWQDNYQKFHGDPPPEIKKEEDDNKAAGDTTRPAAVVTPQPATTQVFILGDGFTRVLTPPGRK